MSVPILIPHASGTNRDLEAAQAIELFAHPLRRAHRIAATAFRIPVEAEQRHDAVANELVDLTASALDGFGHAGAIAVEHEHHVEGQARFRKAREAAQIGE